MNKSKQDGCAPRTAVDLERKYSFGQTFAEVYDLVSDARKAAEEAKQAMDNLTEEQIFNILTNYGEWEGIYRDDAGGVYINASYIKGDKISSDLIDVENLKVKHLDGGSEGEGTIVGAEITGSVFVASADVLHEGFDEAFVLLSPEFEATDEETGEPIVDEETGETLKYTFAVGGIGYEFDNGFHTMRITNDFSKDDENNYINAIKINAAHQLSIKAHAQINMDAEEISIGAGYARIGSAGSYVQMDAQYEKVDIYGDNVEIAGNGGYFVFDTCGIGGGEYVVLSGEIVQIQTGDVHWTFAEDGLWMNDERIV